MSRTTTTTASPTSSTSVGQNYREQEILKAHADKPTRKIIGTENTHDRNQWIAMRDHPEYSGQFLWSGIDYLGEAGRWPSIGAGSGLLLTTSLPRARAFERQSWWSTTTHGPHRPPRASRPPRTRRSRLRLTHLQQSSCHSRTQRPTRPHHPLRPAAPPRLAPAMTAADQSPHTENVEIYTNAEEVELFLNDKSLGTQKLHPDASPITFQVPFEPGTLKAIARTNGKIVAQDELRTAGKPAHLLLTTGLTAAQLTNPPTSEPTPPPHPRLERRNLRHRHTRRRQQHRHPRQRNPNPLRALGPAQIIAVDNGNLLDHDPFQATDRKLYEGHALAILRATARGNITLTATTEGLPPATITLHTAPSHSSTTERSF